MMNSIPPKALQELLEMDQRQRIFEQVIIERMKVVQDFVK